MSEETQVTAPPSRLRYLVVFPFLIAGYFAGGMIGVAIAKLVGMVTNCKAIEGYPACNFEPYLQVGTVVGAILLPALVVWGMRHSDGASRNPERG